MQPLLDVPEGLVVVVTILPLATAMILPHLFKMGELRGEVKDRNARASGKANAMEGDGVALGTEGGMPPADEGGPGNEDKRGVHAWRPHRREVVGVTQGQGPEEVEKVEGRMELDTPLQTKMGWSNY